MCDHTALEYTCAHRVYLVKAWCTIYPKTYIPCGLNLIEMSVFVIIFVVKIHSVAKLGICRKKSDELCGSLFLYHAYRSCEA